MNIGFEKLVSRVMARRRTSTPPILMDDSQYGWPKTLPTKRRNGTTVELCVELPSRSINRHRVTVYPHSVSIEVYLQNSSLRRVLPLEKEMQGIQPEVHKQGLMLVLKFRTSDRAKPALAVAHHSNEPNVTSPIGGKSVTPRLKKSKTKN